jgi:hypothetical protein
LAPAAVRLAEQEVGACFLPNACLVFIIHIFCAPVSMYWRGHWSSSKCPTGNSSAGGWLLPGERDGTWASREMGWGSGGGAGHLIAGNANTMRRNRQLLFKGITTKSFPPNLHSQVTSTFAFRQFRAPASIGAAPDQQHVAGGLVLPINGFMLGPTIASGSAARLVAAHLAAQLGRNQGQWRALDGCGERLEE